jgi:hypothetical protein
MVFRWLKRGGTCHQTGCKQPRSAATKVFLFFQLYFWLDQFVVCGSVANAEVSPAALVDPEAALIAIVGGAGDDLHRWRLRDIPKEVGCREF